MRDSHYKGAEKLNRGQGYKYPHDYPESWVNQQYLPDKLKYATYYKPKESGKYEHALGLRYEQLKNWRQHHPK